MDKKLENILNAVWTEIKRKHLYPNLPPPIFGETDMAHISSISKQIIINPSFVMKVGKFIGVKQTLSALLDHEVSHFTFCPWDFCTHLSIYLSSYEVLKDKRLAEIASGYFMDVCANTYCVSKFETEIPLLYKVLSVSPIDKLICGLYQRLWNLDLGAEENHTTKKLSRIPYLNRERWIQGVKIFSLIIKKYLKNISECNFIHNFARYSHGEIETGLRKFALQVNNPKKFKEAFKLVGKSISLPEAALIYHQELASKYSMEIIKKIDKGSGSLFPYLLKPWEYSSPLKDVDIWNSFGKIAPSITKIWKRISGSGEGKLSVPDCLIIIDSSGSMTNPNYFTSYAVVAAMCAANAYLLHDSMVAVYNFAYSPSEEIVNFTKDRSKIFRAIIKFFGGGTRLDLAKIKELLGRRKNVDIFMITDMKIYNLEEVINFFLSLDSSRVTLVHTKHSSEIKEFKKRVRKNNVSIFYVKKESDIPKIVLGKVKEYLGTVIHSDLPRYEVHKSTLLRSRSLFLT